MKKIFIYYSRTGNGDDVARFLSTYGYETYKVTPKHNLPKSFFWGTLFGGMLAGMNRNAPLKDFNVDFNKYDEIIVGSPVWNDKLSTPINTLLKKVKDYKGKIRFILYSGSGNGSKASLKISKTFADTRTLILKEPKKHVEQFDLIKEFLYNS